MLFGTTSTSPARIITIIRTTITPPLAWMAAFQRQAAAALSTTSLRLYVIVLPSAWRLTAASCGRKSPAVWRAAISIASTSRRRSASGWISEARLGLKTKLVLAFAEERRLKLDPRAHGRPDALGLLEAVREAR